jgi:hypothetical protein
MSPRVVISAIVLLACTVLIGAYAMRTSAPLIQKELIEDAGTVVRARGSHTEYAPSKEPVEAVGLQKTKTSWTSYIKTGLDFVNPATKTPKAEGTFTVDTPRNTTVPKEPEETRITPSTPAKKYAAPGLSSAPAADNEKEILHTYGNTVGEVIQTSIRGMGDQNALLGAFFKDTTLSTKVIQLAEKYEALAVGVGKIEDPKLFTENAERLSLGYAGVGEGLRLLATAKTDTDMYAHLISYNTKVAEFAERFIPFAQTFGAAGITFTPDEPGGMFNPVGAQGTL